MTFLREILGAPPSPAKERLRELAHEYHQRTEQFDQLHCKHRTERGIAIPATPEERSACTNHAITVRDELGIEAAKLGFSPEQWHEAIAMARYL